MLSLKHRMFVICALVAILATAIHAAPTQPISYQGRLTDASGNAVANGTYNVTFTIYSIAKLGPTLWTEEHKITTSDGLFIALLGSIVPFDPSLFSEFPRYLGITIDAGTVTPRVGVSYRTTELITDETWNEFLFSCATAISLLVSLNF